MSFSEKEIFGILSIATYATGYMIYVWSIFSGKVKPHIFSWIIWATTEGIAYVAQIAERGGPGSWVTGFATFISLIVVGLSLVWGEKNTTRGDWISFSTALMAIPLWYLTKNPLWSVILVTSIDVIGYYPTMRKSYLNPWEESRFLYGTATVSSLISVFALENFSTVTALYPIALVVCNGILTAEIFFRRHALKKS